jgi:hypothetical protein
MTYLVATMELVFDEKYIIDEMLETGEYGIGGYPITQEAMVEFVRMRAWGYAHEDHYQYNDTQTMLSVKNEEGDDLFYWESKGYTSGTGSK